MIIFGFANLLADGFAMGFGEYTSAQAQLDYERAERVHHSTLLPLPSLVIPRGDSPPLILV